MVCANHILQEVHLDREPMFACWLKNNCKANGASSSSASLWASWLSWLNTNKLIKQEDPVKETQRCIGYLLSCHPFNPCKLMPLPSRRSDHMGGDGDGIPGNKVHYQMSKQNKQNDVLKRIFQPFQIMDFLCARERLDPRQNRVRSTRSIKPKGESKNFAVLCWFAKG